MAKANRLTGKQELWLRFYLGDACLNATEAARLAGYKDANQSGLTNRTNVVLRARIDEELKQRALSGPEVLEHIADVATADWKHFLIIKRDKDGEIVDVRMDLNAKMKALELLGKHHQLFTDRVNIGGDFIDVLKAFGRGDSNR